MINSKQFFSQIVYLLYVLKIGLISLNLCALEVRIVRLKRENKMQNISPAINNNIDKSQIS